MSATKVYDAICDASHIGSLYGHIFLTAFADDYVIQFQLSSQAVYLLEELVLASTYLLCSAADVWLPWGWMMIVHGALLAAYDALRRSVPADLLEAGPGPVLGCHRSWFSKDSVAGCSYVNGQ